MKKTDEHLGETGERGAEVGGSRAVVCVGPRGSPICPFLLSAAQSWAGCLAALCLSLLISRPHCAGWGPLPRQLHWADDTEPSAQGIRCGISPQLERMLWPEPRTLRSTSGRCGLARLAVQSLDQRAWPSPQTVSSQLHQTPHPHTLREDRRPVIMTLVRHH